MLAFEFYSTGNYSDNNIAKELNDRGYKTKAGKPFSTDMVRDMLQNRTYLGYVKYQPYQRHSDGRRSWNGKVEWFPGKHQAMISKDLFDRCQEVRYAKAKNHEYYPKHRVYSVNHESESSLDKCRGSDRFWSPQPTYRDTS